MSDGNMNASPAISFTISRISTVCNASLPSLSVGQGVEVADAAWGDWMRYSSANMIQFFRGRQELGRGRKASKPNTRRTLLSISSDFAAQTMFSGIFSDGF